MTPNQVKYIKAAIRFLEYALVEDDAETNALLTRIEDCTKRAFGVTENIRGNESHARPIVECRQVSIYLAHKEFNISTRSLETLYNLHKDTIQYSIRVVKQQLEVSQSFSQRLWRIKNIIRTHLSNDRGPQQIPDDIGTV